MKCQAGAAEAIEGIFAEASKYTPIHPYDKTRLARVLDFLRLLDGLDSETLFIIIGFAGMTPHDGFRKSILALREVM